jgi:hypothetical protein
VNLGTTLRNHVPSRAALGSDLNRGHVAVINDAGAKQAA